MLEGIRKLLLFGIGHAEFSGYCAPARHSVLNFRQYAASVGEIQAAVRRDGQQRVDRRLRTGGFRNPGLQLPGAIREWIDVERRCEPPLAMRDMQEAVIA